MKIIFGGTSEERAALEQQILAENPSYAVEYAEEFFQQKEGFFKKRELTMEELLMKDSSIRSKGEEYMMNQVKALDVRNLLSRYTKGLSRKQRELFSLIRDVANGKREFLFNDEDFKSSAYYHLIACWLRNHECSFIWITQMSFDEVFSSIAEFASNMNYQVYELKQEGLVECDKNILSKKMNEMLSGLINDWNNVSELEGYIDQLADETFDYENTERLFELLEVIKDPAYYYEVACIGSEMETLPYEARLYFSMQNDALGGVEYTTKCTEEAREILAFFSREITSEVKLMKKISAFKGAHNHDLWYELADKLDKRRSESDVYENIYQLCLKYGDKELDSLER